MTSPDSVNKVGVSPFATFILSFDNCLAKPRASLYRQLASRHMCCIFLLKILETGHKNDILMTDDSCGFRLMKINSSDWGCLVSNYILW